MKTPISLWIVLGLLLTAFHPAARTEPDVEHGRYLVHHVAMCIQCHTPRDAEGNLITTKLLHGESVPVSKPFEKMAWASLAPHIAGLPGYPREDAVRLLTQGITHTRGVTTPPMPPFRMSKADAEDVVAYLLTLD